MAIIICRLFTYPFFARGSDTQRTKRQRRQQQKSCSHNIHLTLLSSNGDALFFQRETKRYKFPRSKSPFHRSGSRVDRFRHTSNGPSTLREISRSRLSDRIRQPFWRRSRSAYETLRAIVVCAFFEIHYIDRLNDRTSLFFWGSI